MFVTPLGPGDVEGLTAQSCHDARIDPDPAGVLSEGDVAYPVVPVLDCPMVLDGAREGLGGQHHGRGRRARSPGVSSIARSRRERSKVSRSTRTMAVISGLHGVRSSADPAA